MSDQIGNGTAKGLIDYLDSLVSKGRTRTGIITPLKTAVIKILEITEGEGWESIDITRLDIDDAVSRFKNLTMGKYTAASYRAYEVRMKRATKGYEKFLQNPGWFPKEESPSRQQEDKTKLTKKREANHDDIRPAASTPATATIERIREAPRLESTAYPFPLSNGETARIFMPKGLNRSDVKRLAGFLEALVIDSEE